MNNEFYAAIDVGTSAIKLVVLTRLSNNSLAIVGMSQVPSRGIKKGVVSDLGELTQAIKDAAEDIYIKTGIQVTNVIASIPSVMVEIRQLQGMANISPDANNERRVKPEDISQVTINTLQNSYDVEPDKEIIDIVPDEFIIDQFGDIETPLGMVGATLEMKSTAYLGPRIVTEGLRSAINGAGLTVSQFIVAPLALSKFVLSEEERQNGAILMDFGADQTTTAVMQNNRLSFISYIPQGGNQITKDIASVINETYNDNLVNLAQAEDIKTTKGIADPLTIQGDQVISVTSSNTGIVQNISVKFVSQIIEARIQEIIESQFAQLKQAFGMDLPNKNIVITGGTSALTGLNDLVSQLYNKRSTLFVPSEIGARHPGWSIAIASAHVFAQQKSTEKVIKDTLNMGSNNTFVNNAHNPQQFDNNYSNGSNNGAKGFFKTLSEKFGKIFND